MSDGAWVAAADEISEMHDAFARETGFQAFEEVQAEVFDHLLAVVPEFGLRVFQTPTGADLARLAGATAEPAGATHDLSEGA